ncbi:MAG: CBS and ACT domain-containing protein [Syntrophobacteraceae bacterium]|nr:CBS and ACT domain-containing protein [Desulfobacteraceae bacterium]
MIVRNWMTSNVVTVKKGASIQEALAIMKQTSVRHLPVVEADGNLIGWVTDADLRGVLIASMLEELTLEDVMIRKPFTATPDMPLEEAAHIILEKRIGGLPVLEDRRVVGVITVVDILSAFINIMGMLSQSSRVDVRVDSVEGPLHEIIRLIQGRDGEVISICHVPSAEEQKFTYSIRLKKCDLKPVIDDLEKNGIEVVHTIA